MESTDIKVRLYAGIAKLQTMEPQVKIA